MKILLDKKLDEISRVLLNSNLTITQSENLLGDKSGIALFLFQYSQFKNEAKYYDFAYEILESIANVYRENQILPTSISKFEWLLLYLEKQGIIDLDIENIHEDIDYHLYEVANACLQKYGYDFLHGALGIVLYFLKKNDDLTSNFIFNLINTLELVSDKTQSNIVKWLSVIDYKTSETAYNISMSHGLASIIAMLSKIYKQGINQDKTKYLLEGAVNYLLQQKLPNGKYISVFPNFAIESMKNL